MDYFLAIAVLYGVGVQLFRFFRFLGKQMKTGNTAASPMQQAIADAQRQAQAAAKQLSPTRTPLTAQTPLNAKTPRPEASFGRRPDAGGSAVPNPATDEEFRTQVQQLEASEEKAYSRPRSAATPIPTAAPRSLKLFASRNDLVRAFIMQEVLGTPRSRRQQEISSVETTSHQ